MSFFPVLANSDNVFYVQPIVEGESSILQTARAVASSLFYRYTGINSGSGSSGISNNVLPPHRRGMPPLQLLQTVFAEWLLVYAHLSDVISMSSTDALAEPFIGTHQAPKVMLAASGNHVPSFVSLLGFLSDWVGSVVPLYSALTCGDTLSAALPLLSSVNQIRVTALSKSSPVYRAYISGCGLSATDFIHSLNTMFTNSRVPEQHPTRVIAVVGHDPSAVRVRRLARKQSAVPLPLDISVACSDTFAVTVPSTIRLLDEDIPETIRGVNVLVCKCNELPGAWFPVYPVELSDAVLQRVPVLAAAETFVNAITVRSPGFAELREITSKALLMGFILPALEVKQIIRAAFSQRFPDSKVAGSDGVSLSVAVTLPVPPETEEAVIETPRKPDVDPPPASRPAVTLPVPPTPRTCDMTLKDYITTLYFPSEIFIATLKPHLAEIERFYASVQFGTIGGNFFILHTDTAPEEKDGKNKSLRVVAKAERRKRPPGGNLSVIHLLSETEVFSVLENSTEQWIEELGVTNLSDVPRTSVVFTREDLLAITLSGERSHHLMEELWDLHVKDIEGSNFEDDASDEIIKNIVEFGCEALKHAGLWAHGVLIEIIFSQKDGKRATDILAELYESLQVLVVEYKERTLVSYRNKTAKARTGTPPTILIRAELFSSDSAVSLVPLTRAFKLAAEDIDAITEPWLRGVCISLTQLSLFKCAQQYYEGNNRVRDAFRALLQTADPGGIHASELAIAMSSDMKAFRRAIVSL